MVFTGVSSAFHWCFNRVSLSVSSRVSSGEEGNSGGKEGAFGGFDTCVSISSEAYLASKMIKLRPTVNYQRFFISYRDVE